MLTKPLGTGILATALKGEVITEADMADAIHGMTTLNRGAAEAMLEVHEEPPKRHTEDKRRCQAEVVASVARDILRRGPLTNVIVLGDMNEHEFRGPMEPFENAGLVNMMERVPLERRYSYNYLGNSQVLDNVFVSASVADRARLHPVHINSDLPDSSAASDHDPLLLVISPPG